MSTTGARVVPLPDRRARKLATEAVERNLFVEAGAGSGKTTVLVERVLHLIDAGVPVDQVVAITFTEKAAAELRARLRAALGAEAALTGRRAEAIAGLDGAPIGTLHAFAQRLLVGHPVEAGLPPRIDVLDEIASQAAFAERWDAFRVRLLDDPAMEQPLLRCRAAGITLDHLRLVAVDFGRNWDLVAERVVTKPATHGALPPVRLGALATLLADVSGLARFAIDGDKLAEKLHPIGEYAARLAAIDAGGDDADRIGTLLGSEGLFRRGNAGKKANWRGIEVDDVKAAIDAARDAVEATRATAVEGSLWPVVGALARFTIEAADERRREGLLEFHDLLALARALLRNPRSGARVRDDLRARYHCLLLDEFQDTDPIQLDLATLLATDPRHDPPQGTEPAGVTEPTGGTGPAGGTEPDAGRLFFVGDPKQSIYRFRRADIATYFTARHELGADVLHLTTNFRTTKPVVEWINHVFAQLISPSPGSQPAYTYLHAVRPGPGRTGGPAVLLLGADEHVDGPDAAALREREAQDVAEAIGVALADEWQVRDGDGWRRARPGDVTILVPARTSLPFLERALERAGLAYRAEASSLVYGTREVRDLIATLRAVDDPSDEQAIGVALRSCVLACSDVDLYDWKVERGGSWSPFAPLPPGADASHPVAEGLAAIAAWHGQRHLHAPSDLIERICDERRLYELALAGDAPRDLWRRLRFVTDQARAWADATADRTGATLRAYLLWVAQQATEGARVAEVVLPETDHDAVRIMTIHAAKGLEFPIVVLSGLTTAPRSRTAPVDVVWPPGDVGLRIGSKVRTTEFIEYQPIDEQMDHHERLRLLYVAATRACDHLVVSLHRKAPPASRTGDPPAETSLTAASLFARACLANGPTHQQRFSPGARLGLAPRRTRLHAEPIGPLERWQAEQRRALAAASRPASRSATQLAAAHDPAADPLEAAYPGAGSEGTEGVQGVERALDDPGLAKGARDLELPPWHKGRYGTAVGRAVHGVLQAVPLAGWTDHELTAAVAAQCMAEGVNGEEALVGALARSALGTATVQEAASLPHWRETYAAAPIGNVLVEGYLDLLYRTPDGLVVVDHKTDRIGSDDHRASLVERYRVQLGAYAAVLEAATGEPVVRAVLVFCDPAGATEVAFSADALADAKHRALDRASAPVAAPEEVSDA